MIVQLFVSVVLAVEFAYSKPTNVTFELVIIHTNDVHSRFEQASATGGRCRPPNPCFGGTARMKTAIQQIRSKNKNVLLLDGGDQFQGTLWFTRFKEGPIARFMKALKYDAMAIGNHEFDAGISTLVKFIQKVNFPVLSCNIDATEESQLEGIYYNSTILTRENRKIGIVGYTSIDTPIISYTGRLNFSPEIPRIQAEVNSLIKQNVDIVIALGHSGIDTDKLVATHVDGVDVVVGAHSHTFMYTPDDEGNFPNTDETSYPYPWLIDSQVNPGKKVPIVQAFQNGKYLGELHLVIDQNGEVVNSFGSPILLDDSIERDNKTLQQMKVFKEKIERFNKKVVGYSYVFLDGDRKTCRTQECNLGNLVTDGMVDAYQIYPNFELGHYSPMVAVITGGGIRSSIELPENQGAVLAEDINIVLPFTNTIDMVELQGRHILAAFQYAANNINNASHFGGFIQVSGIKVVYDIRKPLNNRVVSLQIICNNISRCPVPVYEPIQEDEIYKVVMDSFLANGGDGYTHFALNKISHVTGNLDIEVFSNYVKKMSPIRTPVEGRTLFVTDSGLRQMAFN